MKNDDVMRNIDIENNSSVSIVIPCWNGEKTIGRMLDSIKSQSYQDWKAIVVDDQSTDGSVAVLKQYAEKDERISFHIRDREPKGAQTCRNIGFELLSNSKYICFFDADDALETYCLEQRVNYMERHPDIDFGIFPARAVVSDSREQYSDMIWGFEEPEDSLQRMLQRVGPMVGWTNIYKKTSILNAGLYWDEKIRSLQDSDWNIQALLRGLKYGYAINDGAKIDYQYIVGDNVITKEISSKEHCESHIYFLEKLICSLNKKQQRKYFFELNGYYVWAGRFCARSKQATKAFMRSSWVRERPFVKIRFIILFMVNYRFSRVFFPIEFIRNNRCLSGAHARKSEFIKNNF